MNKGLYKHKNGRCIYWYKTWKNSSENSGRTLDIWGCHVYAESWSWENCEDNDEDYGQLVGAACLAQW